jgi:phosphoadenosine phosphosulfate reductase
MTENVPKIAPRREQSWRKTEAMTRAQIEEASVLAESWEAEQVVRWACSTYGQDLAIASAFGAEGVVLIDVAVRVYPNVQIFTLDTQFFFPETYELIQRIEQRYDLKIQRILPSFTPEQQNAEYGSALWSRNPERCCWIRKVEPLQQKLRELKAWMTAIRRDQTSARAGARKIEWDQRFGLVKINPLADWTAEMVWSYIRKNELPYNPMHDRNYPSIGCTHCTRPVLSGEEPRAGRWPGLHKTECGLHSYDDREVQVPAPPLPLL